MACPVSRHVLALLHCLDAKPALYFKHSLIALVVEAGSKADKVLFTNTEQSSPAHSQLGDSATPHKSHKFHLLQVVKSGFNADYGLFTSTEHGGMAFPQPASSQLGEPASALLRFLGAIFGKALYEGILLDTPLAPFFVAKLQGRYPLFDDLQAFDPEMHRSLVQLKR